MDLSVVVLSWNTAELTVAALRAARAGAGTLVHEILCVDNGSTDGTAGLVRREVPEAVLVLNGANLGFAAGNNRALPHLHGRYTCFLNSDCEPGHGALAHVVRWMDRTARVGVASPRLVGGDGRTQAVARPDPDPLGLLHRYTALRFLPLGRRAAQAWTAHVHDVLPRTVASVMGACLVVRTDLLRRLGGFDEGYPFYWEDVDLCRRARDAGFEVAYVPDGPSVLHHGGVATAQAGGPPRLAFVQGLLRYVGKAMGERAGRAYAAVFGLFFLLRAPIEAVGLGLRAFRRAARGRRRSARRTLRTAAGWMRFLERDVGRLVRLLRVPG